MEKESTECAPRETETIEKHLTENFLQYFTSLVKSTFMLPFLLHTIKMEEIENTTFYSFIELFSALLVSMNIPLYPPLLLLAFKKAQKKAEKEAEEGTLDGTESRAMLGNLSIFQLSANIVENQDTNSKRTKNANFMRERTEVGASDTVIFHVNLYLWWGASG